MENNAEVKTIAESNDNAMDVKDIRKATDEQLNKLADGIVSNEENVKQVKVFPDAWDSLEPETKKEIV